MLYHTHSVVHSKRPFIHESYIKQGALIGHSLAWLYYLLILLDPVPVLFSESREVGDKQEKYEEWNFEWKLDEKTEVHNRVHFNEKKNESEKRS